MLEDFFVPFIICFALPVGIVWLSTRYRTQKAKLTSEILMAAIQKDSNINIDGIARILGKDEKKKITKELTSQERNLQRLQIGSSALLIGIGFALFYFLGPCIGKGCFYTAIILLGIGIGTLVTYFVGKHSHKD